ncbi:uncharacterized protein SPPG_00396 [Spizellomyces punctatus DAOM BR117]|uniref:Uncharacterized protein n=1 Tax=Spizellomyces punctatus (strain DAOM BR117) TaxID=645134 RepID=A0A0L0HUA4_SPIPD|nr:uncharacterized protein SPPG_00396 [Spizellomyces punctatus DAOM BR117]KND04683.1 hypothetical protein SPPG_00396 [Spizellomyces punctatus DAOM BR117]|eukprot:XP_016612722.1 hypothetical protein SPPG_00396 [Spizellomyces punctatus DAOM BR117]
MIFVFVVDTSASMNRLFSENLTFLESAKAAIEHFFKWEHASSSRKDNRYMLVAYEEPYYKTLLDTDNDQMLLQELKILKATDLSTAGAAFAGTFDYLDNYRRRNSFDNIGRGRYPADLETTTMFWFTDGSGFMEQSEDSWVVSDDLNIPRLRTPGSKLYAEPYRWDQRLYTLWLTDEVGPNKEQVNKLSNDMGGQWWQIPNVRYLLQCIDNCMRPNGHPGVHPYAPVCNIEGVIVRLVEHPDTCKWISTPEQPGPPEEKLIVYSNKGSTHHFPIPESYWIPGSGADDASKLFNIPPRSAQPKIYFTKRDDVYPIPEGFPVDRFSIDQKSAIVRELMQQPGQPSWTLFVQNSDSTPGFGKPFGTLKYSGSSRTVSLYIMPYDFPKLFGLLLMLKRRQNPSGIISDIVSDIGDYIRSVPIYYREPLKKAFATINLMHIWPKDVVHDYHVGIEHVSHEAVRKAKTEALAVQQIVQQRRSASRLRSHPQHAESQNVQIPNIVDIPRDQLATKLQQIKASVMNAVQGQREQKRPSQEDEDHLHMLPISEMGNYAPRMAKQQRLRDPFEDDDVARQRERNMFGNPYRMDKKISIDEEDEASQLEVNISDTATDASSEVSTSRRKRKWRSVSPSIRPYNRHRVPRLSPSPAPVLVMPPVLSWKEIKEGKVDVTSMKKKAQEEYIQKRSALRDASPVDIKESPRDQVKTETPNRVSDWLVGVHIEAIEDSDEEEQALSEDMDTDPNTHMPPDGDAFAGKQAGAAPVDRTNEIRPPAAAGGTTGLIAHPTGVANQARKGPKRKTPSPEPDGAYDGQVQQKWGRWDSFVDVRRRIHSLIWRLPRDYNQNRVLKTLDVTAETTHLTTDDKHRILKHAIRAGNAFRRQLVAFHAQSLLDGGRFPEPSGDIWWNDPPTHEDGFGQNGRTGSHYASPWHILEPNGS